MYITIYSFTIHGSNSLIITTITTATTTTTTTTTTYTARHIFKKSY